MVKNRRLDEQQRKAKLRWKRIFAAVWFVAILAFGAYQSINTADPVSTTENDLAEPAQSNPELAENSTAATIQNKPELDNPELAANHTVNTTPNNPEPAGDHTATLPDASPDEMDAAPVDGPDKTLTDAEAAENPIDAEAAENLVDGLAEALAAAEVAASLTDADQELGVYRSLVDNGDTLGSLLEAWLTPAEIHSLPEVCQGVYPPNRIRQGQPYAVHTEGENFLRFEYEIDHDNRLVIRKTDAGFTASKEEIEYRIVLHRVEGSIASSLFTAMQDSGEHVSLAAGLADVFAWEINFIRDLREGDSFNLLVEKRYRDGEFKNYGKLLAATFTNQGDTYEAYLFTDEKGNSLYFNAEGESLRRAFLKAPLAYNRISSGYTKRRLHPIRREWRAHPAIDYAAPKGTPVKSVGRGTVVFKGYDKGAGNYIKVSHANGYETMYLHLSGFARGLAKGNKISQGQIIGFVGSTGYSTGPHLDFRMKRSGTYINPLKELSPRDTPVTAQEKPRFLTQMTIYRDFLESRRNLAEYSRSLLN